MSEGALVRPPHLEGLDRYEPGLSAEQVAHAYGLSDVVKLASNENPLGASARALEAARSALAGVHRYPDGPGRALRAALASRLGVRTGQVALGNGSTDLIDLLARAFLGPDDDAIVSEAAFARFRQVVAARNGRVRTVPMRGFRHDLPAMAAAAGPRTRLVFVANPNNPTGTWNTRGEVAALRARLPEHVVLVLDEAYFEYVDAPDHPDGTALLGSDGPVVVLRTFSKVHGLAGLRVGYAVAREDVIEALDTVREPFNTNAVGQAAALAALEDHAHVARAVALARGERVRLAAALEDMGLEVLPSQANFLCVRVGDGAETFRRLLPLGVVVRPLGAYALDAWLRVSLGTEAENDRFLAALAGVLGSRS